ncbi:hypothetical protein Cyrtocomes_00460 [Candidatus Cyrtobacter comes]|uniref:Uncharacterized protein n=1 Tax=Candidatus Cyrtobacter comes TaxID=675776 RepID=A0ABU5L7I0_9RICK|nr:hypothetical protein [Candidatus Cyrtobacter comes]
MSFGMVADFLHLTSLWIIAIFSVIMVSGFSSKFKLQTYYSSVFVLCITGAVSGTLLHACSTICTHCTFYATVAVLSLICAPSTKLEVKAA